MMLRETLDLHTHTHPPHTQTHTHTHIRARVHTHTHTHTHEHTHYRMLHLLSISADLIAHIFRFFDAYDLAFLKAARLCLAFEPKIMIATQRLQRFLYNFEDASKSQKALAHLIHAGTQKLDRVAIVMPWETFVSDGQQMNDYWCRIMVMRIMLVTVLHATLYDVTMLCNPERNLPIDDM